MIFNINFLPFIFTTVYSVKVATAGRIIYWFLIRKKYCGLFKCNKYIFELNKNILNLIKIYCNDEFHWPEINVFSDSKKRPSVNWVKKWSFFKKHYDPNNNNTKKDLCVEVEERRGSIEQSGPEMEHFKFSSVDLDSIVSQAIFIDNLCNLLKPVKYNFTYNFNSCT